MEADLDAVMLRFRGIGHPKRQAPAAPAPGPAVPDAVMQQPSLQQGDSKRGTAAAAGAAGAAAAAQSGSNGKQRPQQQQQQQEQQQRKPSAAAASKRTAVASPSKAAGPREAATAAGAPSAVPAATANNQAVVKALETRTGSGSARAPPTEPHGGEVSSRAAGPGGFAAAAAAANGKGDAKPFKGFGPSPEEIKAALAAGAAAAAAPGRGGAAAGPSKAHASGDASPKKPTQPPSTVRIFFYSLDEAGVTQAIVDARLQGQVLLETDVKQCVAVVSAKQGRNGKRVQSGQGERMAANAGIPFICVGRKMNGVNLREAMLPLLSPGSRHALLAQQQAQEQALLRQTAGAAVRAAKVTGFFTLPVAGPGTAALPEPASAAASAAPAASSQPPAGRQQPGARPSSAPSSVPAEEDDEDEELQLLIDGFDQGDSSDEEEEEEEHELVVRAPAVRTAVRRMTVGTRSRSALKLR